MSQSILVAACLIISLAATNYYQSIRNGQLRDDLAQARLETKAITEALEGEREAYQQAIQLAASIRLSEQRLESLNKELAASIKRLGDQHVKEDPCFYQEPDSRTLDALPRADWLRSKAYYDNPAQGSLSLL